MRKNIGLFVLVALAVLSVSACVEEVGPLRPSQVLISPGGTTCVVTTGVNQCAPAPNQNVR